MCEVGNIVMIGYIPIPTSLNKYNTTYAVNVVLAAVAKPTPDATVVDHTLL